jgi:hypothetical protein
MDDLHVQNQTARIPGIIAWAQAWVAGRPEDAEEKHEKYRVMRQEELASLTILGVRPDGLAGRLRLVLTIGCYRDFRFTRDILSSSAAPEQIELVIEVLTGLGAHCDCEVFYAIGQLPRGVLWHHSTTPGAG